MKAFLAFLAFSATLLASFATASLIPRQTLPPGYFYIKAFSTDPTVNGKFAFVYLSGGTIFIGPVINHQGWEPIVATFNASGQTVQGGFGNVENLWVIRDKQGATVFTANSPSLASLDAPYSVLPSGEITSLWTIPYPWGWTTCKQDTFNGPGSNILYYQKFGPTCTPVQLLESQGPVT
jgi:hypothetical protein